MPQREPLDLLPGTLDLLVLRVLEAGPLHGYGIAQRVKDRSKDVLPVGESPLYPALQRLLLHGDVEAEWGVSDNNRRAPVLPADERRPDAAGRRARDVRPDGRRDPARASHGVNEVHAPSADSDSQSLPYRRFADDLEEELALHRALAEEAFRESGLGEAQARAAASRALGNEMRMRERARAVWVPRMLPQQRSSSTKTSPTSCGLVRTPLDVKSSSARLSGMCPASRETATWEGATGGSDALRGAGERARGRGTF
jgi:hypothetical protein